VAREAAINFDGNDKELSEMPETFDFVVVGGGSAGAVIAARLSEDPSCRVALIEAGAQPPPLELMPVAAASMQGDAATDWRYRADAGKHAGRGLFNRTVFLAQGKMLGGTSGINYMVYVRGHPGDFDRWAEGGAAGWSYADVLPFFKKSEGLAQSSEIPIDASAHSGAGPLGVSVRSPLLTGAREFVTAAMATGIKLGDYNGRDRGGPAGMVSLVQITTRNGKRSSTYHAFLEGAAASRANLKIIAGATATRVVLEGARGHLRATGVEYRFATGDPQIATAETEVILSAGAIGSPHLLMLSGVGPRKELRQAGVPCRLHSPHVGKHLKDHLQIPLFFLDSAAGVTMADVASSADEWQRTGQGLASSALYDAAAFFSTGLGDRHGHDAQIGCIPCGYDAPTWSSKVNLDIDRCFDSASTRLGNESKNIILLPTIIQPHSEGEIVLRSADYGENPAIHMNYFADQRDMRVMVAALKRSFEIAAQWPEKQGIGAWWAPPFLAEKHGYEGGKASDALLEDLARYFAITLWHPTCTCRMGGVVDARLRVEGVRKLRVADASVMPNIVSGNTNAASIMIGERAAELIAIDHGVQLAEFVDLSVNRAMPQDVRMQ
jgi:choline dehydrogenase